MTRAERRRRAELALTRTRNLIARHWWHGRELLANPAWLGRMVSTHKRPCSCANCQRERYHRPAARRDAVREIEEG